MSCAAGLRGPDAAFNAISFQFEFLKFNLNSEIRNLKLFWRLPCTRTREQGGTMKTITLCGITLLTVAPAFAQTSAPATADRANTTVTMTGCVGSSADSSGFTLSNAMVIPGTAQ